MIVYKDIMKRLADAGWSSYKIRRAGALSEGTLSRIRNGESITTDTVDKICELCDCQPGDVLEYVKSERAGD